MEKYEKVLYILTKKQITSQRALAKELEISLGQVNYLLKEMVGEGLLVKANSFFQLTERGRNILEELLKKNQEQRLEYKPQSKVIKKAVILAAGKNQNFDVPVGLLKIEGISLIEHMITALNNLGIEQFIIVTGDKKDQYEEYFANRRVTLVENPKYKWTGTMASLYAARDYLNEDFLLVESNQIVEEIAYEKVLHATWSNCMLLASPSDSMDEAYVELQEEGSIFRISKDIKQLNRIDAELIGVSKISMPLFSKMMEYYESNKNPFLNYEYAIESIGRLYHIHGVLVDDLLWSIIENDRLYHRALDILFPKMKKRAVLRKENNAREILVSCLNIENKEIEQVSIGGGMTNHNFYVKLSGKEYILRIPGACTEQIIDRQAEQKNSLRAAELGVNPTVLYFSLESGIKITEYIKGARTLNPASARMEVSMRATTDILKKLHNSNLELTGSFNPWREYEKYKMIILEGNGGFYQGYEELEMFFYALKADLNELGENRKPCHNDLVAENFVSDDKGRMYLIDWEYAGMNDPMWDIASHLLECEFSDLEEELYLQYYFEDEVSQKDKRKICLFKICQDVLWSAWTIMKETRGEDFGAYGRERFARALKLRKEYEVKYEKAKN